MNLDTLIPVIPNPNIPVISSGDTVKVSIKAVEGERVRTQMLSSSDTPSTVVRIGCLNNELYPCCLSPSITSLQ